MIIAARTPTARRWWTPVPVAAARTRRWTALPATRRWRPPVPITITVVPPTVTIAVNHGGTAVTTTGTIAVITAIAVTIGLRIHITDAARYDRRRGFSAVVRIATRAITHITVIRVVVTPGERETGGQSQQ
jgi:hypothetical protein